MPSTNALTASEVYEVLRDAAVASRSMRRITEVSWNEIYCGLMAIDIDDWRITFFIDCGDLDYCDSCVSADGRRYDFSAKDDFDPVALLSPEEHFQLEDRLRHV